MLYVHETYFVPALKFNFALFTVMWLPSTSLHAVETWSQKKEPDPCVMREPTAMLKCDFWHEQQHWRMEDKNEERKQVLDRKEKDERREEEMKGRKKKLSALLPLARLFFPRGVVLIISPLFQ